MSVGLLVITHNQIGAALLDTASAMLGACPLSVEVISVSDDCDPEQIYSYTKEKLALLETDDGVIVLTDMYGSTPSNIATRLQDADDQIIVISGINLPMLVRLLNYPNLSLQQLADKALSGGCDGIINCRTELEV